MFTRSRFSPLLLSLVLGLILTWAVGEAAHAAIADTYHLHFQLGADEDNRLSALVSTGILVGVALTTLIASYLLARGSRETLAGWKTGMVVALLGLLLRLWPSGLDTSPVLYQEWIGARLLAVGVAAAIAWLSTVAWDWRAMASSSSRLS